LTLFFRAISLYSHDKYGIFLLLASNAEIAFYMFTNIHRSDYQILDWTAAEQREGHGPVLVSL
jgi:hypothetical protein